MVCMIFSNFLIMMMTVNLHGKLQIKWTRKKEKGKKETKRKRDFRVMLSILFVITSLCSHGNYPFLFVQIMIFSYVLWFMFMILFILTKNCNVNSFEYSEPFNGPEALQLNYVCSFDIQYTNNNLIHNQICIE